MSLGRVCVPIALVTPGALGGVLTGSRLVPGLLSVGPELLRNP